MGISCVRVAQFLYRKAECIRASAERERRSQWHHAVAEESESLRAVLERTLDQFGGHPISHSTNSGLSRRPLPDWKFSACAGSSSSARSICPTCLRYLNVGSLGVCQSRCEFGALGKDGGPGVGVSGSRWKVSACPSRFRNGLVLSPLG